MSVKSMTQCLLQILGRISANFNRFYGSSIEVRVKSDLYRMSVTHGDNDLGTGYVLHLRKVKQKSKDRQC